MIAELLTRARFTPHAAARYLGVSLQTVRRYLRRDQAPKATIEALRRAPWYSPETVEYLEKLAAIKALEITRRAAAPVMVSMHRPLMGPAVDPSAASRSIRKIERPSGDSHRSVFSAESHATRAKGQPKTGAVRRLRGPDQPKASRFRLLLTPAYGGHAPNLCVPTGTQDTTPNGRP